MRSVLTDIYADHCGGEGESREATRGRFEAALERDYFMTAREAVEFGLVDEVVQRRV
jgi:ATP-dependent Clp protease protease subunit